MARVKLKTLSEHLGLTEGTVSRALNNYPDISESTRQRVMDAARDLGYKPNSMARRLATGQAECAGFVLPAHDRHLSEPFLAELLDGLTEALSLSGWDLMVSVARSSEDELRAIRRLVETGRVSAMVVSRVLTEDKRVDLLQELGIPFVVHGRTADPSTYAWFDVDGELAFVQAVEHLHRLGHLRIAHIGGLETYNFARLRRLGYLRGMSAAGLPVHRGYELSVDMTEQAGHAAMNALLRTDPRPTGVICVTDMVALGAMRAIRQAGLQPGHDIAVIGYDGLSIGEHTNPALTSMAQPLVVAGKRIGEMLLAVAGGADPTQLQELRRAELVRRESDGPAFPPREAAGQGQPGS